MGRKTEASSSQTDLVDRSKEEEARRKKHFAESRVIVAALVDSCGALWSAMGQGARVNRASQCLAVCVCRAEGVVGWWTSGLVGCLEVPALDQAS